MHRDIDIDIDTDMDIASSLYFVSLGLRHLSRPPPPPPDSGVRFNLTPPRIFRVASLAFQRGASDAAAYLNALVNIFGLTAALTHVPELIALCPEKQKYAFDFIYLLLLIYLNALVNLSAPKRKSTLLILSPSLHSYVLG